MRFCKVIYTHKFIDGSIDEQEWNELIRLENSWEQPEVFSGNQSRNSVAKQGAQHGDRVYKESRRYEYDENRLKTFDKNGIIGLPIGARNTAKGKPFAVKLFDIELNNRQKRLLENLLHYDDKVVVAKEEVDMKDLAALTAKTGVEFALFTKDNSRMVVRGNEISVNIDIETAKQLAAEGYKWSGHTHPGADDPTKIPSSGDLEVLAAFGQTQSVIYDSVGRFEVFER